MCYMCKKVEMNYPACTEIMRVMSDVTFSVGYQGRNAMNEVCGRQSNQAQTTKPGLFLVILAHSETYQVHFRWKFYSSVLL